MNGRMYVDMCTCENREMISTLKGLASNDNKINGIFIALITYYLHTYHTLRLQARCNLLASRKYFRSLASCNTTMCTWAL